MKTKFIYDFWQQQAEKYGNSHWASWGDKYMVQLEVELISNFINKGQKVLDVGCANGYSTLMQFDKNPGIEITGIDFSEQMIYQAKKRLKDLKPTPPINFQTGNVLDLPFTNGVFDIAYTTRTLINLPTWNDQVTGIKELIRVVKKGGRVVLSEAFWEPLMLLNSLRSLVQLPAISEHDFNRYLKVKNLEEFLGQEKVKFQRIDFSSVYYLGSRFLRELVTDADKYPGYSNPINEIFYNIEKDYSGGGFGVQQAYILQL